MTHEELAVIGLTEKDIPNIKPDRIRRMIAWVDGRLKVWSLPKQDVAELKQERKILLRMLAEIEQNG